VREPPPSCIHACQIVKQDAAAPKRVRMYSARTRRKATCVTLEHLNAHLKEHETLTPGMVKCINEDCCNQCFVSASELREHSQKHKVQKFTCNECGKVCGSMSELEIHMLVHYLGGEGAFRCQVAGCEFAGKLKIELKSHKRHVHDHPGLNCQLCGEFIQHLQHFKLHTALHESGTPGVFKCAVEGCSRSHFISTDALKRHNLRDHAIKQQERTSLQASDKDLK
jgi:Zinc finger, C2H2 type